MTDVVNAIGLAGSTADPNVPPLSTLPIVCDTNGVLYSKLVGAGDVVITLQQTALNSDAEDPTQIGVITAGFLFGFNQNTGVWNRVVVQDDNSDNQGTSNTGHLACIDHVYVYNGVTWDRHRSASAANQSGAAVLGSALSASPAEWTLTNAPVANTAATATKAAVAGTRHILRSVQASINAVAAITVPLVLVVRDGATGVGAILWQDRLTATIGTDGRVSVTGLNIAGTTGNAMTVEFTAAPGLTNFETVSATGYDVA